MNNLPAVTIDKARIQPAVSYIASLRTEVSRRGQISALNTVAVVIVHPTHALSRHQRAQLWQRIDWTTLNAPAVRAIMAKVNGAPATRNKVLSALRGVARMAWESDLMDVQTFQRIRDLRGDIGLRLASGRAIETTEIKSLIDTCVQDETPAGIRDAALIALLCATGMRRAEVCALHSDGIELASGSFRVIGKRNKERTGYLAGGALEALRDWMTLRGNLPGPIFCAISKSGVLKPERHISTATVNRLLVKRATQAGISDITPHDFRRTYIGQMLDAGADIATVAALVGHEDVKTTARYDRRGERSKQAAATLVSVPYKRRVDAANRSDLTR